MKLCTKLRLDTWRWRLCARFRLWRIGDALRYRFPRSRVALKIWGLLLPF